MSTAAPYFDDLTVGQRFTDAPAFTLTDGAAALHQAILGDRLRLPLDRPLAGRVAGGPIVHPGLVWDVAIGQSTVATRRVLANLFYRGLVLRRHPMIGDTLSTVTEVAALRETTRRQSRPARGLAVLHITTRDQEDRSVLDFTRCAMLPLSPGARPTGHNDDVDVPGAPRDLTEAWASWDLSALPAAAEVPEPGSPVEVEGGDVVSAAPELARLTLNVAIAHHDASKAGGRRLVYGGHTIGIAAAQATRLLPGLATIAGWQSCDHTGPVHEGDLLRSTVTVEGREGALVHLRSQVKAQGGDEDPRDVLDWRYAAVVRA